MFWGLELSSCKAVPVTPEYPLHVTKCTLAEAGNATNEGEQRNVVQCQVGGSKSQAFIITSLRPGAKEQASLDLVFEPGVKVTFFNSGPGIAHLTGFYVSLLGEGNEEENTEDPETKDLMELLFNDDSRRKRNTAESLDKFNNENESEKKKAAANGNSQTSHSQQQQRHEQTDNKKKRRVSFVDDNSVQQQQPPTKTRKVEVIKKEKPTIATSEKKKRVSVSSAASEAKKASAKSLGTAHKVGTSGLIVQDTVVGTGPAPVRGRKIVVGYVGRLTNGKVFDKSDKRYPFSFKFGAGEVIKGWDLGIAGMKVGGKRRLTIPPELGYGREGAWPIPPNATLIFDVELIAVK